MPSQFHLHRRIPAERRAMRDGDDQQIRKCCLQSLHDLLFGILIYVGGRFVEQEEFPAAAADTEPTPAAAFARRKYRRLIYLDDDAGPPWNPTQTQHMRGAARVRNRIPRPLLLRGQTISLYGYRRRSNTAPVQHNPARLRNRCASIRSTGTPPQLIAPPIGGSRPINVMMKVVLPRPEGPQTSTKSPFPAVTFTGRVSATVRPNCKFFTSSGSNCGGVSPRGS